MGRGFFKSKLATRPQGASVRASGEKKVDVWKKDAASPDADSRGADAIPDEPKKDAATPTPEQPDIYTDQSVCLALGIRRRVLAEARTRATRGTDWDCIELHAGMTRQWIEDYALEHGVSLDEAMLTKVGNDKHVSVRFVGHLKTPYACIAELEADGSREYAQIRNINAHPMKSKQVFDCIREGISGTLAWTINGNDVKY